MSVPQDRGTARNHPAWNENEEEGKKKAPLESEAFLGGVDGT